MASPAAVTAFLIFLISVTVETSSKANDSTKCPFSNVITEANGRPVPSQTASLTVGPGGPILLSDSNLLNHIAHFDRERIPERVVHAKGAGAHGYFVVTHDITKYTKASVFGRIGRKTRVLARFSALNSQSGSPDPGTDIRGLAVKFYTDQGNWDLTMLSVTVFPVRDPILFPGKMRSMRRNPRTHLIDPNTRWDFTNLRPEGLFTQLQLSSDRGRPDGFRHMNLAAIHAFKFINSNGKVFLVKFHLISEQGLKNMTTPEAMKLAGTNPDYFLEDLYNAIENKNYPAWKLFIQIMTPDEVKTYRWNPFDSTKEWLQSDFPFIPVGRVVFNRNPDDYFSEVEMAAFDPTSLVPGIEMSPDPLLHGRAISYHDSQRHRLGPNFQQFPINRPKYQNSFDRDGVCAANNGVGKPNYYPNSFDCSHVDPSAAESKYTISGEVDRVDTRDDDNYSQPKLFIDGLSPPERSRLVDELSADLGNAMERIRNVFLDELSKADQKLADDVRAKIHVSKKS